MKFIEKKGIEKMEILKTRYCVEYRMVNLYDVPTSDTAYFETKEKAEAFIDRIFSLWGERLHYCCLVITNTYNCGGKV